MNEEESPLLRLFKEGKLIFKNGKMIALGEMGIIVPVRIVNRLYILLREKLNAKIASSIFYEIGSWQVKKALERYVKILEWSQIEKQKGLEFGFKFLTSFLGIGIYQVTRDNNIFILHIDKTPFAEEFVLEYGKQKYSVDHYICGMWGAVFTAFLGKPMVCEEVKCYAKGDDCCEFVVKPKEETEEKETK